MATAIVSVNTDWEALVNAVSGMVAASSARVYRDTLRRWQTWAGSQGVNVLDLNYNTVRQFLADGSQSKASQQRDLAALRKAADVLAILDFSDPARRAAAESLRLLKVQQPDAPTASRQRRALSAKEAELMLRAWDEPGGVHPTLAARNRALIAVLLLTGVRRAEAAALKWSDIDFDNGVLRVACGKGGKPRDAAIYGDAALEALRDWQMHLPRGYEHVFVAINKAGQVGPDRALTTTAIYDVVVQTAQYAGVGRVAPHDLRRTLITELLATGAALQDVQAQAGHARGSTTLRYALATDARARRRSARLRYG